MLRTACFCFAVALAAPATASEAITGCEAKDNLRPICQFQNPEDLAPLPGGEALLVSEYGAMEGGKSGRLALYTLTGDERPDSQKGWASSASSVALKEKLGVLLRD